MSDDLLQPQALGLREPCGHATFESGQRYISEALKVYGHLELSAELAKSFENLVKPVAENEGTNDAFENVSCGLRGSWEQISTSRYSRV